MEVHIRRDIVHFALPARPRGLALAARHGAELGGCDTLECDDAGEAGRGGADQGGPIHGAVAGFEEDFASGVGGGGGCCGGEGVGDALLAVPWWSAIR